MRAPFMRQGYSGSEALEEKCAAPSPVPRGEGSGAPSSRLGKSAETRATRRLVDRQVDMFRHQDVSVDPGLMTCPGLFQNGLERLRGFRRFKERKTVKATERDELKGFRFLEPLQAIGHGSIVTPLRPCPKTRSSR